MYTFCVMSGKTRIARNMVFLKANYKKACEGVGIKYIHIPELGIESEKRRNLCSQKDYDVLFDDFEKKTLINNYPSLLKIRKLIDDEKRVALTCFENNPYQCHRTRVAKALMQLPDVNYTFKVL